MLLIRAKSTAWEGKSWYKPIFIYRFSESFEDFAKDNRDNYHNWRIVEVIKIREYYMKAISKDYGMTWAFGGGKEKDLREFAKIFYFGFKYSLNKKRRKR